LLECFAGLWQLNFYRRKKISNSYMGLLFEKSYRNILSIISGMKPQCFHYIPPYKFFSTPSKSPSKRESDEKWRVIG
jgi:hypothetical protein